MSNLHGLRKLIANAEQAGDVMINIKTEEAKLYLREAEAMHGGNRILDDYQREIAVLNRKIQKLKDAAVDKVGDLLEG